MITNPYGWRARYQGAIARKQEILERQRVNSLRYKAYNGETVEYVPGEAVAEANVEAANAIANAEATALAQELADSTAELASAVQEVPVEEKPSSELRAALEEAGFEVPKNTGRGRLIEIYKEKIVKVS